MSHSKLNILSLNSNSICGKLAQLNVRTETYSPHIVAITEAKIDSDFEDNELLGPDYTIIRKDRNKHGGDVLLTVLNTKNIVIQNNTCDIYNSGLSLLGKFKTYHS